MLQFEELKRELEEQEAALQDLGQALGLEKLREEVEMLEHKSAEPGFWDNMEQAQKITQRMAALKGKDEAYQKLQSRAGDCMALIEMGDEAEVDFERGVIISNGKEYPFPPYPEFVQGLINDGGLIPHVKKELGLA